MPKILLVEDDPTCASMVRDALVHKKFEVDVVTDGDAGLQWLITNTYALAIVDWELPKLSGRDLCLQYRARSGHTPILMLTGRSSTNDVIGGLDAGADDYLAKPFDFQVLMARARALMRRTSEFKEMTLQVQDIELDASTGIVTRAGMQVKLTRKEFSLLYQLMSKPNTIFSADRIVELVWPTESDVTGDAVRCVVNRLRSKLNEVPDTRDVGIKNVYGMGYKIDSE